MAPPAFAESSGLPSSVPRLPRDVAQRFGARVLDRPTTPASSSAPRKQASAYLGQCLLVTGAPSGSRTERVRRLAATTGTSGLDMRVDTRLDAVAEQLAGQDEVARDIVDRYWVSTVHLAPTAVPDQRPGIPVDAWPVLQRIRSKASNDLRCGWTTPPLPAGRSAAHHRLPEMVGVARCRSLCQPRYRGRGVCGDGRSW